MNELVFEHVRIDRTEKSTLSTLKLNNKALFFLLEDAPAADQDQDGDLDKVHGQTCIEPGEGFLLPWFDGKFFLNYSRDYLHKFALALQMTKGVDTWGVNIKHGNIRVHMGLEVINTEGCPLTGRKPYIQKATGDFAFLSGSSGEAYKEILYPMLFKIWTPGQKDFKIPVRWIVSERF